MNDNVKIVNYKDKTIYLIGTAHVSAISAQEVTDTINEIKPDSICIELDAERYDSFKNPKKWEDMDISKIIKEHKTGFMVANLILSSYQKRVAKQVDSKAGGEMVAAMNYAEQNNTKLELVDRNIQVTFKRIWRKHSFFQKMKLIFALIGSIFEDDDITPEDIENLKNSDTLDAALKDISKQFPVVSNVLIHERDQVLSYKIKNAPGKTIVAVLGAAHIPGVIKEMNNDQDIKELESIPDKTTSSKIVGWIIPALIIGMIVYLFISNKSSGMDSLINWILWNGTLSAIGVLLAKGSILAIITAFIASPITSLNPLLAAGWFAGLVEAYIKKPKMKDFNSLYEDCSSVKGFYKNGITHILLVVILANLFSTIGTVIGGADVFINFINQIF